MAQNILNRDCLTKTYYAHIHSHIVYAPSTWGSVSSQKDIDDIYKLQKACVRCLHKAKKNAHTDPLFKQSCILKLPDMVNWNC